jgi:hypothetical protein
MQKDYWNISKRNFRAMGNRSFYLLDVFCGYYVRINVISE